MKDEEEDEIGEKEQGSMLAESISSELKIHPSIDARFLFKKKKNRIVDISGYNLL